MSPSVSSGTRARVLRVAAVAALALLLALAAWLVHERRRDALERLPPDVRLGLYERAREDLAVCIEHRRAGLDELCEDRASFLVRFPECDEACRSLAEPFLPAPSR